MKHKNFDLSRLRKDQLIFKINELQKFLAKEADEVRDKIDPHNCSKDYYEGVHRGYEIAVSVINVIFGIELPERWGKTNSPRLENFHPRPMREVEYFGVKISVPADTEWVATDDNGEVISYPIELEEQHGIWVVPQHHKMEAALIGSFEPIDENDAIKTLRHYPIEGEMTEPSRKS